MNKKKVKTPIKNGQGHELAIQVEERIYGQKTLKRSTSNELNSNHNKIPFHTYQVSKNQRV